MRPVTITFWMSYTYRNPLHVSSLQENCLKLAGHFVKSGCTCAIQKKQQQPHFDHFGSDHWTIFMHYIFKLVICPAVLQTLHVKEWFVAPSWKTFSYIAKHITTLTFGINSPGIEWDSIFNLWHVSRLFPLKHMTSTYARSQNANYNIILSHMFHIYTWVQPNVSSGDVNQGKRNYKRSTWWFFSEGNSFQWKTNACVTFLKESKADISLQELVKVRQIMKVFQNQCSFSA